jgi:hypothetical protein
MSGANLGTVVLNKARNLFFQGIFRAYPSGLKKLVKPPRASGSF